MGRQPVAPRMYQHIGIRSFRMAGQARTNLLTCRSSDCSCNTPLTSSKTCLFEHLGSTCLWGSVGVALSWNPCNQSSFRVRQLDAAPGTRIGNCGSEIGTANRRSLRETGWPWPGLPSSMDGRSPQFPSAGLMPELDERLTLLTHPDLLALLGVHGPASRNPALAVDQTPQLRQEVTEGLAKPSAALVRSVGGQETNKPPFLGTGGSKEFDLVPPAGFEPAPPPPEGGALSPELRGLEPNGSAMRSRTIH